MTYRAEGVINHKTLRPAGGSMRTTSLRLWGNDASKSRAVFECPGSDCRAVVMGMQNGFVRRSPAYFAVCLHCSSAYIVIVGANEYYIRDLADVFDPAAIDETVAELKKRMSALQATNA